jgi:hypothetical protein
MVTYREIRSRLSPHFRITDDEDLFMRLMVRLPNDRQQGVGVLETDRNDGTKLLAMNTPVAPLAKMDAEKCLEWNAMSTVGALALHTIEEQPYVTLVDTIPYTMIDLDQIKATIEIFAFVADNMEKRVLGGVDWY